MLSFKRMFKSLCLLWDFVKSLAVSLNKDRLLNNSINLRLQSCRKIQVNRNGQKSWDRHMEVFKNGCCINTIKTKEKVITERKKNEQEGRTDLIFQICFPMKHSLAFPRRPRVIFTYHNDAYHKHLSLDRVSVLNLNFLN